MAEWFTCFMTLNDSFSCMLKGHGRSNASLLLLKSSCCITDYITTRFDEFGDPHTHTQLWTQSTSFSVLTCNVFIFTKNFYRDSLWGTIKQLSLFQFIWWSSSPVLDTNWKPIKKYKDPQIALDCQYKEAKTSNPSPSMPRGLTRYLPS